MKKIILLIAILFSFTFCKDDKKTNPVVPEVNPFADSANIKFYFNQEFHFDVYPNDPNYEFIIASLSILDFNANIKTYHQYEKNKNIYFKLYNEKQFNLLFLDTLDNLFLNYKFLNFTYLIPDEIDTTSPVNVSDIYLIGWKKNIVENLKIVKYMSGDIKGIYPDNFDDFIKKLDSIIYNIRNY